jgi:Protein of unknown function (DUF2891)
MTAADQDALLREAAAGFAEVILASITREYPNDLRHPMTGPDDRPLPHEVHPSFCGCYDWHSAVEMHWALLRLLRTRPDQVPQAEIRARLDVHLDAAPLATEAAYFETHRLFKRPYGWGWALKLAFEAGDWDDPDSSRWAASLGPLAEVLTTRFLEWLPKATYPERDGAHTNSVFGLSLALLYAAERARSGEPELLAAITEAAHRWYGEDRDYPAAWEPSGSDFLSPALAEAELMASVMDPADFRDWLDEFLPGLEDERPAALFTPAVVPDGADGLMAHLHGLNLSRAYCWNRLAQALPDDDPRISAMQASAQRHTAASLPEVTGGDYMVEHWLACYAVLLLT